jgi:crossover junction endodeoxyribonuclease RuvC
MLALPLSFHATAQLMAQFPKELRILGVDPGTQVTGYGLVDIIGKKPRLLQYGVIKLGKHADHALRLHRIFERMLHLIDEYAPDHVALEAPFFGKNVQSMLKLGRAQGAAMAAALHRQIPITEYAPKLVKKSVTGNGTASKEQVAGLLMTQLSFTTKPDDMLDATDALAVALTHHIQQGVQVRNSGSWANFLQKNPGRVAK